MTEVGVTNKTHRSDYFNAVTNDTAILLKVHTSNYKITGFTEEVSLQAMVELGREKAIALLEYLDRLQITERMDDVRKPGSHYMDEVN